MKIFKRLARRIVTAEANRTYRKAIRMANERHEVEGVRIYVIDNPSDPTKLLLISMKDHRYIRHKMGIASKQQPESMLKQQCWYYTENTAGKDKMQPRDLIVRRLAFVRDRLDAAGLLDAEKK